MPLKNYGVLKGAAIDRKLGSGPSPHYQVHIVASDVPAILAKAGLAPRSSRDLLDAPPASSLLPTQAELDDARRHLPAQSRAFVANVAVARTKPDF